MFCNHKRESEMEAFDSTEKAACAALDGWDSDPYYIDVLEGMCSRQFVFYLKRLKPCLICDKEK